MNIVFSSDNNYAPFLGIAIYSLLENNQSYSGEIDIYILDMDISIENKSKISKIVSTFKGEVHYIDTKDIHNRLLDFIKLDVRSLSTWYRIYLTSLLPKSVTKLIYMDCDSYINAPIIDLWNTDIADYDIAGVMDTISNENKTAIGLTETDPYFNAGMLIINLEKWRSDNMEKQMLAFIKKHKGKVIYHDQGTINGVCLRKKILHPKFNAMTPFFVMSEPQLVQYHKLKNYYNKEELLEAKTNPVFCHLTPYLVDRPWVDGNFHPLRKQYDKLVDKTPWKGEIDKTPSNYLEPWKKWLFNFFPFWVFMLVLNSLNKLRTTSWIRKIFGKHIL